MVDIPLLDPQPCIKLFLFFSLAVIYIALTRELIRISFSAQRQESTGMRSADRPEGAGGWKDHLGQEPGQFIHWLQQGFCLFGCFLTF